MIIPIGTIMTIVQTSTDLGQRVRTARRRQRLTQAQLAALAGVGIRFVRELEHGKAGCHIGLALTVLQTLGLSLHIQGRDDE